jgi:hypothetical protein
MTRAQRRAHGAMWALLAVALVAACVLAHRSAQRWAEVEASASTESEAP